MFVEGDGYIEVKAHVFIYHFSNVCVNLNFEKKAKTIGSASAQLSRLRLGHAPLNST